MELSPIVIFTYSRFNSLKQVISALQNNILAKQSDLYIYSDAPKNNANEETKSNIIKIRQYIKTINGFQSVKIIEREENFGLSQNIINGVTEIINQYKKIIVLEDDIIVNKHFLNFMNDCLNEYRDEKIISGVSGYQLPIKFSKKEPFLLMTKLTDCWGWGTWKDRWEKVNWSEKALLQTIIASKIQYEFNLNNSYNYVQMLQDKINGKNDSWAIRWYASMFIENRLFIHPRETFLKNIGFNDDGTHCSSGDSYMSQEDIEQDYIGLEKTEIKNNLHAWNEYAKNFRKQYKRNYITIAKKLLSLKAPGRIFRKLKMYWN